MLCVANLLPFAFRELSKQALWSGILLYSSRPSNNCSSSGGARGLVARRHLAWGDQSGRPRRRTRVRVLCIACPVGHRADNVLSLSFVATCANYVKNAHRHLYQKIGSVHALRVYVAHALNLTLAQCSQACSCAWKLKQVLVCPVLQARRRSKSWTPMRMHVYMPLGNAKRYY